MTHRSSIYCLFSLLLVLSSCNSKDAVKEHSETKNEPKELFALDRKEPHQYGGWYCPDNLNGFPAVDIDNWKSVPVVHGRMPTEEETRNGSSLILVDLEKYPEAKPLDMEMPMLAKYYNHSSGKNETIIVIQALSISNDSIVGFRYLNGGNGSARLNEIRLLSNAEIARIPSSRFVSLKLDIQASRDKIWTVLTAPSYYQELQSLFDTENVLGRDPQDPPKVNFRYQHQGSITSSYAGELYGNQYIQIDSESGDYQYVEKFLLGTNEETNSSELVIVCGPYESDYEAQKSILSSWAYQVKVLSEKL